MNNHQRENHEPPSPNNNRILEVIPFPLSVHKVSAKANSCLSCISFSNAAQEPLYPLLTIDTG
jgi:nitrate reductase cytochrome c-type subunit